MVSSYNFIIHLPSSTYLSYIYYAPGNVQGAKNTTVNTAEPENPDIYDTSMVIKEYRFFFQKSKTYGIRF